MNKLFSIIKTITAWQLHQNVLYYTITNEITPSGVTLDRIKGTTNMKIPTILITLLFYITVSGIVIVIVRLVTVDIVNIQDTIAVKQQLIGKTIVLQQDTLLVTDYSFFDSNYKLSNGTEISEVLVKTLKQVNK